jgi:hypothetical protein
MTKWQDQPIFGDYLIHLFEDADVRPVRDAEHQITLGNQYFQTKAPLEKGDSESS